MALTSSSVIPGSDSFDVCLGREHRLSMPVEPLSRCLRDFSRGSLYRQQIYEMWRQLTIRPSFGCFIEMVLSLLFLGWRGDDRGGGFFFTSATGHIQFFFRMTAFEESGMAGVDFATFCLVWGGLYVHLARHTMRVGRMVQQYRQIAILPLKW